MKLNNDLRDKIAAKLADNAVNERRQARAITEHELALAIYAHAYKPTTRKAMDKLPAGWLPTTQNLGVRVSGADPAHSVYFIALPAPRRILAKHCESEPTLIVPRESEFAHRLKTLRREIRDIELQYTALRRAARLTLESIATLRQFGERWPEAKPVAMAVVEKINRTASKPRESAIGKADLNTALGLTPTAQALTTAAARKAAPMRAAKKAD